MEEQSNTEQVSPEEQSNTELCRIQYRFHHDTYFNGKLLMWETAHCGAARQNTAHWDGSTAVDLRCLSVIIV